MIPTINIIEDDAPPVPTVVVGEPSAPCECFGLEIADHACYYCDNTKGKRHPGLEFHFKPASITAEDADKMYTLGLSRYGDLFEFPLTFEDCCYRYRIRNNVKDLKYGYEIKKALKDMEDGIVVMPPLLNYETAVNEAKERARAASFSNKLSGDDKKSTQRRQRAASHGQTSGKEFLEKAAPPSFMSKSTDSIEPPLPPKLEDAGKPKLTVSLKVPYLDDELFDLWTRYQVGWHHNVKEEVLYRRKREYIEENFLNSPIKDSPYDGPNFLKNMAYGSRYVCFRLDGKLIGVMVADLLPNVWGGLYILYDPDYAQKKIGTYLYAQGMHLAKLWGLSWYDPGWYIRTSSKMKYKDIFEPLDLFCPVDYKWVNFTKEVKERIDLHGATKLLPDNPEAEQQDKKEYDGKNIKFARKDGTLLSAEESDKEAPFGVAEKMMVDLVKKDPSFTIIVHRKELPAASS